MSAHQAQAPEFPPYCSEENVITGLQHPSNKKSPVNPGLVGGNQSNKDKGASFGIVTRFEYNKKMGNIHCQYLN